MMTALQEASADRTKAAEKDERVAANSALIVADSLRQTLGPGLLGLPLPPIMLCAQAQTDRRFEGRQLEKSFGWMTKQEVMSTKPKGTLRMNHLEKLSLV